MNQIRILMLDNEFPPLGGGTGVVNYHLLKELEAYPNVWVDLITSGRGKTACPREQFAERIFIYRVPVDNRNIHHSSNRELLRYAWQALWLGYQLLKRNRYDVSFAFAGVPAGVVSCLLHLTTGLPYVVSLQGPDVPGFEARYNYLYPFLKPILCLVWRNAGLVTAISRKHQELAHQTLANIEIPIVPNGVESDLFYPADERTGSVNVLCVGRLIERKGQYYLLQAFAQLCEQCSDQALELTLVGTGDAEDALKSLASELRIQDRVHFVGFVPREEMPRVYRQADIFVLPSQSEGMSIALLEAMSSGLPVIVTDTGGTEELVKAGENGLIVEWADVPNLTKALNQLAGDCALRRKMGVANRDRAHRLSWEVFAERHVELLSLVISERMHLAVLPERRLST